MSFSLQRALGAPGRPQTPDIDVGWSAGMPRSPTDVPRPLPMGLRAIPDPLHRHWTALRHAAPLPMLLRAIRAMRMLLRTALRHFCGPMPMERVGYGAQVHR